MKNESLGKQNPSRFADSSETTSIKTINSVLSERINNILLISRDMFVHIFISDLEKCVYYMTRNKKKQFYILENTMCVSSHG